MGHQQPEQVFLLFRMANKFEEPISTIVILFVTFVDLEMLNDTYRIRKPIAFIFEKHIWCYKS